MNVSTAPDVAQRRAALSRAALPDVSAVIHELSPSLMHRLLQCHEDKEDGARQSAPPSVVE